MQNGQTDLETLTKLLNSRRGCVRLALERCSDGLLVKRLLIEVSPAASREPRRQWEYGDVVLVGGTCTGREAGRWFAGRGEFLGYTFAVPGVHEQVSWQEHPSNSSATFAPLPWPFTSYELGATPGLQGDPTRLGHAGFLVARGDAPSFANADVAVNRFLYGLSEPRSFGMPLVVRIARADAWIRHVHLTPTAMAIRLGGRSVVGCRVELMAVHGKYQPVVVEATRQVRIPLPSGLPQGAILLLSRDGDWRDDRWLDPAHRMGRTDFSWDDGDRRGDLEALIAAGEGATLEFKQEVPSGGEPSRSAMKTAAAFANGEGGVILFGVDDEGKAVGVPDAARRRDAVSNLVRDAIDPVPGHDAKVVRLWDASVIVLTIPPGRDVPYGLRLGSSELRYFVRRGATTFPAESHELREIVLARQAAAVPEAARSAGRLGIRR